MEEVTVLLSTYNGEKYLADQLNSILQQENVKVTVLARDDSSTDSTINILKKYNIQHYTGDNMGPKGSFFNLIQKVPLNTEYYAFSDQDDIWLKNKLFIGVQMLKKYNDSPAVYFCERQVLSNGVKGRVTQCNEIIKFPNVYFKSVAAGCTIICNKAMMEILKKYTPTHIAMHDQWIIILATLFGNIHYDQNAYILYRLHSHNVVGIDKKYKRYTCFFKRIFMSRNNNRSLISIDLLQGYSNELQEKSNVYFFLKNMSQIKTSINSKIKLTFFPKRYSKHFLDDIAIRLQILMGVV